ncbi:uncharacterized protein MEPE_01219 [Melanopsichium pennsylvanicum]|uniref:Uncharacterized protein n=1 Tax=Melanopsichium pennsylvanicum TaxID=63383 RepID=A0AAJ5C3G6_9BASI|nr:uncharacterized protein MEPE_01219 [Melanopsichium pennsylvanicum]
MIILTNILALIHLFNSLFTSAAWPQALSFDTTFPTARTNLASFNNLPIHPLWNGDLPLEGDDRMKVGASISACTFAIGPPGPPASALCSAFNAYCTNFKNDIRTRRLIQLKTSAPLKSKKNMLEIISTQQRQREK